MERREMSVVVDQPRLAFLSFVCVVGRQIGKKNNICSRIKGEGGFGTIAREGEGETVDTHDFACDMMGRDYGGSIANWMRLPS
jgi:hypothetical protein